MKTLFTSIFVGMQEFVPAGPRTFSELVHFRNRIGEKGIELIVAKHT